MMEALTNIQSCSFYNLTKFLELTRQGIIYMTTKQGM